MKLDVLLSGLNNPQPSVRLDVVRVLGMLDETRALEALRQRYAVETDPAVRSAIAWAGKRLYEAQQAGYSTVDEVFRHFGVDREIEHTPDAAEAELMQKMQDNLNAELYHIQSRAITRQAGLAAAAAIGGGLIGGTTMGMAAMAGAMMPGAGLVSSGLDGRPQIGTRRAPAAAPATTSIDIWVRRLREGQTPAQREQAAIELGQLNNPAALPHLAAAFLGDPVPEVRQAAQRFGKILYWSVVYWEMEQDGSLAQEMARRAAALGKRLAGSGSADTTAGPAAPTGGVAGPAARPGPASEPDVSDILRKAQAARARRQKK